MKEKKPSRKSINFVPFLIVIVIIIFASILAGSDALRQNQVPVNPHSEYQLTVLPSLSQIPTVTDLPDDYPNLPREYFENENVTDGIILAGAVLVIIILLGVLISKRNNEKQE